MTPRKTRTTTHRGDERKNLKTGRHDSKTAALPFIMTRILIVSFLAMTCSIAVAGKNRPAPKAPRVVSTTWTHSTKARAKLTTLITQGTMADRPAVAAEAIHHIDRLAKLKASDGQLAAELVAHLAGRGAYHQRAIRSPASVEFRADQLLRMLPRNTSRFLDIGGADGAIAAAVASRLGLSHPNTLSLEVARYESPSTRVTHLGYEQGRMPLQTSSVDASSILMALHHIADPRAVLREANRVLRPDGVLVVRETVANTPSDRAFNTSADILWYSVFDTSTKGVPQKTQFRSDKALRRMFRETGFEVDSVENPEPENLFSPRHYRLVKVDR